MIKKSKLLLNCSIIICGSKKLHNELLAHFLETETKCECSIIEQLTDFYSDTNSNIKKQLILIDYTAQNYEKLITKITPYNEQSHNQYTMALFNLPYGLGIEKKAFSRGIKGFFYEHDNLELFSKGINNLFAGEIWISRDILVKFALEGVGVKTNIIQNNTGLTQREMEILAMVSLGVKNEEIADKLFISPHTVKTHLYHVFKKINVPNRLQAALWAAKHL